MTESLWVFFWNCAHKIQKKFTGGEDVMNDYGKIVLEQYDLEVRGVRKGRGCLICDTSEGIKKLQEYRSSRNHLELEQQVVLYLKENSDLFVDCYVRNREGILYSVHPSQTAYVLKDWMEGNECSRSNPEELTIAVSVLARLHLLLRKFSLPENLGDKVNVLPPLSEEYEKHLREMKRVRRYVREKKKKNEFEQLMVRTCDAAIEQAEEASTKLQQSGYMEMYGRAAEHGWIYHGAFHYHNILFSGAKTMVINFEKCGVQVQLMDLYLFMRKVLEKNSWSPALGARMLEAYSRVIPLSDEEIRVLAILFSYPEKYWKQMNFYYNKRKSWIPQHSLEKLQKAARQQEQNREFVRTGLGYQ